MLDDTESYILHQATGKRDKLHKKGNVSIMSMKTMSPEDEKTNGASAKGELGFTRQESRGRQHATP